MLRAILTPFRRPPTRTCAVSIGNRVARHFSAAHDNDSTNPFSYNPFERLLQNVQQETNVVAPKGNKQDTQTQLAKFQVQDENARPISQDHHSSEPFPSQNSLRRNRKRRQKYKQLLISHIVSSDRLDYEKGIRAQNGNVKRMYMQHIRRKADRDRVCRNCGELGHVARNCLLPVICRVCGDIGHSQHECQLTAKKQNRALIDKPLQSLLLENDGPARFDQEIEEYLAIPKRIPQKKPESA